MFTPSPSVFARILNLVAWKRSPILIQMVPNLSNGADFTVVQKPYAFSRNHTLNFDFDIYLV